MTPPDDPENQPLAEDLEIAAQVIAAHRPFIPGWNQGRAHDYLTPARRNVMDNKRAARALVAKARELIGPEFHNAALDKCDAILAAHRESPEGGYGGNMAAAEIGTINELRKKIAALKGVCP